MIVQAFTGPSRMTKTQWIWAAGRIALLEPVADVWRSGCARGLDTLAAYVAVALAQHDGSPHDGSEVQLFVPHAPHNRALVINLAPFARVIRCPAREPVGAAYRLRNDWMIGGAELTFDGALVTSGDDLAADRAHRLHAFVKDPDFYRSGEWMTINIAERLGVEVIKEVLPQGSSTPDGGSG